MLNSIQLMGRLTAEPETQSSNEYLISRFTLAVPRDYKKKDGERDTDFIHIVAWNSLAKFINENFTKGQRAVVQGSLRTRSYTDKEGKNRTITEVVASGIYFADNKPSTDIVPGEVVTKENSLQNSEEYRDLYQSLSMSDDDYPF